MNPGAGRARFPGKGSSSQPPSTAFLPAWSCCSRNVVSTLCTGLPREWLEWLVAARVRALQGPIVYVLGGVEDRVRG